MIRSRKGHKLELGRTGPFGWRRFFVHEHERESHTYVVGITGKGKSKLLEHILFQDITQGRGCGVLDPHSDLVDDLLLYLHSNPEISENHWKRIIYFDPSRTDYIIPFNVLKSDQSPYSISQNILEAFRRTWPKTLAEAPRFANIVTVGVMTLVANDLSLVELPRLLTDLEFRSRLLARVDNAEVRSFWRERYGRWGRERSRMIESVLNKVTAFTLNPQLRLILGAEENRLNFQKIMDEGKVLLVDLGRCDSETRRLLGSLIVTGLEQAARSRKSFNEDRRPFYYCVDEFQDFCSNDGSSQSLAQILSESRKFGLHLTLAHQTLTQLDNRIKGALGNIQLKVVFGVSRSDAEILARQVFHVNGEAIKHLVQDIGQQNRSHPVFYSLQEEWEKATQELHRMSPRDAYVNSPNRSRVSRLRTITINHQKSDFETLELTRRQLSETVGLKATQLKSEIDDRRGISEASKLQNRRHFMMDFFG